MRKGLTVFLLVSVAGVLLGTSAAAAPARSCAPRISSPRFVPAARTATST